MAFGSEIRAGAAVGHHEHVVYQPVLLACVIEPAGIVQLGVCHKELSGHLHYPGNVSWEPSFKTAKTLLAITYGP